MSVAPVDLRAALHVHGADLGHHPAHGLQGGVVITQVHAAAHEVLLLEDDHAAALVGLKVGGEEGERGGVSLDLQGSRVQRTGLNLQRSR